MEISIIYSIKLPSVSISKICTCRAFPDRSLNSLKPCDILKIIHSNLFLSSTYVINCIERSHKGTYWCHEKSTLGRAVAWRHQTGQQAIIWPIRRHMTPLCLKWVQYLSYIVDIKLVHGLVLLVLWLSAGMALDKLIMNNFPSLNGKIEIHDSQCNLRS